MEQDAITVLGVEKRFGRGAGAVTALDGLSLSVPQGCVYGLLGPNGAGKSTLLRIAAGLLRADRGEIRLFGGPAGPQNRRRFGMLIEQPSHYPFLTAREHLRMFAATAENPLEPEALLARLGLAHAAGKKAGSFSLGMKQRLGLACALVCRPQALILDEPTNGLDPDGMQEIRGLIRELSERDGMTVLVSSHLLDEVERMCDRVAILRRGRLAAEGAVADLLDRKGRFWLDAEPQAAALQKLGARAEPGDGGLYVRVEREDVPELIRTLVGEGVAIREAKWVRPDLESVFLDHVRAGPEQAAAANGRADLQGRAG